MTPEENALPPEAAPEGTPEEDVFGAALMDLFGDGPESTQNPRPPRERYQIQNLSHQHEAIMNWLIANPQGRLKDCAAFFGVTREWITLLIRTDLFKARMREKQDFVFHSITGDLTTKLTALADVSIDKLQEKVEESEDPRFLLETSKLALANLGFGAKPGAVGTVNAQNVQQNFYVASPADLSAARERMGEVGMVSSNTSPPQLVDATPSTQRVSDDDPKV